MAAEKKVSKAAMEHRKKREFIAMDAVRNLGRALVLMERDASKFDARERGWKPAGTRLRKDLYSVVKAIQQYRKMIQEVKTTEG